MRALSNYFRIKQEAIERSKVKHQTIGDVLDRFFREKFNQDGSFFYSDLVYNSKEKTLTIVTKTKVIASELTVQLAGLHEYLKKENILLNRILIK